MRAQGGAQYAELDPMVVPAPIPRNAGGAAGQRPKAGGENAAGCLWGQPATEEIVQQFLRLPPEGRREVLDVLEMCVRQGLQCPHGE